MHPSRPPRTATCRAPFVCTVMSLLAATCLLLDASRAGAACNPGSCDADFPCGFRSCVGLTCQTFLEAAGAVCRPALDVCDRDETCSGSSLSCPADTKLSSANVCRPAVDVCDGAERCNGSSNACPPDVGLTPEISRVTLVDADLLHDGEPNANNPFFQIEITGQNLCTATIVVSDLLSPIELGDGTPSDRLGASRVGGGGRVPSATYSFDVNHGAAAGTLEFVAGGAPDGFFDILAPSQFAKFGGAPSFTIANQCPSCDVARGVLADDTTGALRLETPASFAPPPLDTPIELGLDDFEPLLESLPEGHYFFEAEAIDGSLVADTSFAGDTSGVHFAFLTGTSVRNKLNFTVPEAQATASALGALAALGVRAAARRRTR